MKRHRLIILLIGVLAMIGATHSAVAEAVTSWPAPAGEVPSPDFALEVNGRAVFVYQARVRAKIHEQPGLWTHAADPVGERAAFAIFDMAGPVEVVVRPMRRFERAAVIPDRAGIKPTVTDGTIRFAITEPRHLTVTLDGSDETPLHLFIGRPEVNAPRPGDPNVVYFGPGIHELHSLRVRSDQTVYLAGGAIVRAVLGPEEKGRYDEKWKVSFYDGVVLDVRQAANVRICGRGILDGALVPHPGHNLIKVSDSHNISLEGIVLRDAPNWNVMIEGSREVSVDNLRVISGRLNSDGINSVNSQRVHVRNCFVRNHDDSIAVKTMSPGMASEDIDVEDCVVWNDWGYALGVTYETRAPVRRVSFSRCDVLIARHWCLGVRVSDSATISEIRFQDITVGDLSAAKRRWGQEPKLLSMVIMADCWGKDAQRGRIQRVVVRDVAVEGAQLPASEILGADGEHGVTDVQIVNLHLRGSPPVKTAAAMRLNVNSHVRDVRIGEGQPASGLR